MGKPMLIRSWLLVSLVIFCLSACTQSNTLLLDYHEFGPPAASADLIGHDWWQWQPHGHSYRKDYPIKIVVYDKVSPQAVQSQYPIEPEYQKDYRYLPKKQALIYLNEKINENAIEDLTQTLMNTRHKIQSHFGE